jgi:hypothetical protein
MALDSNSGAVACIGLAPLLFCMWNYYGDHMLLAPYDRQAMALSLLVATMAIHWEMRRRRRNGATDDG